MPGKKVEAITVMPNAIAVRWADGKFWVTHDPDAATLLMLAWRTWKAVRDYGDGYIRPFLIGLTGWVWERAEV